MSKVGARMNLFRVAALSCVVLLGGCYASHSPQADAGTANDAACAALTESACATDADCTDPSAPRCHADPMHGASGRCGRECF
jgi:hypothetical protein